jgi:glucose/arabinose dehydrogenase
MPPALIVPQPSEHAPLGIGAVEVYHIMVARERGRGRTSSRRRSRHLVFEPLEARTLLTGNPPFAVGGDPSVNPADFRVTTFASGLNFPHGMVALSDGSLLVGISNPVGSSYYNSTGELLRFTDGNGDGVADSGGQVLFSNLPGEVTALHQAGEFILATSSEAGSERISVLRTGANPGDALTLKGSINFSFPSGWEHTTFASVVRTTPGEPGNFDVIFNIGSQSNGAFFDGNGNPIYDPTTGTVTASGLISGTLLGDSLYMVTLHDNNGTPEVSNLTRIASGVRNAASLAIDPATGDLYFADNGIDRNANNVAWSADELDVIPAAQIGGAVEYFGFPETVGGQLTYSYVKTSAKPGDPVMVVNPSVGVQPVIAFEPLPDSALGAGGSKSQGSSGFAMAPSAFPDGLNTGTFIGFHGVFNAGGTANDENPVVYANPNTGKYFDFVSNDEPNIGHIDEVLSTSNSLFLADIAAGGNMLNGAQQGVIYEIEGIQNIPVNHPPVLAPIDDQTVDEGTKLTVQASATDPDAGQTITYSLGPGAPAGASINGQSGLFTWTPDPYSSTGTYSITVIATDNGSPPLSDSQSFNVNVLAVNHPPNFLNIPPQTVERTQPVQIKIGDYVSDPDLPGQTLTYSLASGAPSDASIDPNSGIFAWAPSADQGLGSYQIGVVATDNGSPPLSASQTFTVTVVPFNHPPVVTAIPEQTVLEGMQLTVGVTATDSDVPAQTITYSLGSGAPSGAAIDAQSGLFTWTPDPYSSTGSYPITVVATDNGFVPKSGSASFMINVLAVNHSPVIAAIPAQTAVLRQRLQVPIGSFVSDPDRPAQAMHYGLAAGAPAGAAIDPVSGVFTWTLSSGQHIGSYPIGVIVTDSGSPALSQSANFTVNVFDLGPVATVSRASVRTKNGFAITLKFSQPLDPSTAEDPSNFVLVATGPKKGKKTLLPSPIPLTVTYNQATNSVTLTATVQIKLKQTLRLTVIGRGPHGVAKITGLPLAGKRKRPGTNYVAIVTGKAIRQT